MKSRIMPALRYRDGEKAIDWLNSRPPETNCLDSAVAYRVVCRWFATCLKP